MTAKTKSTNRLTKVKDLPREAKELTKKEQKKVKGGATGGAIWIKSNAADPAEPPKK